jgi:uncharacterized protein (DUF433 family)
MGEEGRKPYRRGGNFGRRWPEPTVDFPPLPYPADARFSVKHIAYLHAYCGKEPREIAARYPRAITLAQVHLALYHYFSNRGPIDAEIAAEQRFSARKSLDEASMVLPSLRDVAGDGTPVIAAAKPDED